MKIRWHRPDPKHVVRYSFHERAAHWIVAFNCLYLILGGMALHAPHFYWLAILLGGGATMRYLHPLLGLVYFVTLIWMWWLWRKDLKMESYDAKWMAKIDSYITNNDEELPVIARWNPGQKIFYWIMLAAGFGLVLSGFVLWFPERLPWSMQWLKFLAILTHAGCAYASIGGLLLHVYMGVFLVKGGFDQIITGEVTRPWAKHHHRLWYSRVTGEKVNE
jgi:formate dehydrogenase subunit gamma